MSRSPSGSDVVYALVPRAPLPSFDASKTFRRWLLPPSVDRKYRAFSRRHHVLLSVCYFVGLFFRIIGFLCPLNDVTYWLVVISPILQTPGLLAVSLALCTDVVRLLFGFFDSWMLLIGMILWTVFLGISYSDIRVFLLPQLLIDLQNAALSDAYIHPTRLFRASAVLSIVFVSLLYAEITLNVQGLENVVVFRLNSEFAVTSIDLVQNTTLTVGMLMFRVAVNKLRAARSQRNAVQTIVYRCKVKFEALEAGAPTCVTSLVVARTFAVRETIHQLKYVPFDEHFDARNTIVPRMARSLDRLSTAKLAVLYGTGCVGFFSMIVASLELVENASNNANIVALAATFAFTSTFTALYQHRLLRRLCRSFDCLFVLFQIVTAYVCISYLSFWNQRVVTTMVCNLLWFLWVLGVDALTPAARHKLGMRLWFALPVLLWNFAMSVSVMVDLSLHRTNSFRDRVIAKGSVWGHDVCFYTASFLLNHLLLMVIWCIRLAWRFCTRRHGDECIILAGSVEYSSALRGWSTAPKFGAVVPSASLQQHQRPGK